jgi:flagellar FliL protein
MKKNLMSVLILALVVVNLVLTAITMISIVPSAKKSNELISQVCTALDLELASGRNANLSSVPIENLVPYTLDGSMTINLRDSDDGSGYYVVLSVVISMDNSNEDYANLGAAVSEGTYDSNIKNIVNDVVRTYTYEELKNDPEQAQKDILSKLQGLFDSNMIVDVGFTQMTFAGE